jgi:nucleoside-diphosphate-sugar epimerase
MRVVVIGGTGVLGSKVVGTLQDRGHDAVAASRSTGVDALTREPGKITFEQMARDVLAKQGDSKTVVVDPDATYFGAPLATNSPVVPA